MKYRPAVRMVLVFALLATSVAGARGQAATRLQTEFKTGTPIGAPAAGAANAQAIQAARELQAGPHHNETPDLYERRARAIAVSLGMTDADVIEAGKYYRARAWASALAKNGGGLLRVGPGSSRAALDASTRKARAAMRDPRWESASPGAGALLRVSAPARPNARPNWPAVKTPPLLTAPAPRRRAVVPPVPYRETLKGWSADYFKRADALTEKSTGDSARGWFQRKLLQTQGTFYGLGAFIRDSAAVKQAANAAGESVVRGMFPDKVYEAGHPGTWRSAIVNHVGASVPTSWRLMYSAGSIGAKQGAEDAAAAVKAVKNYSARDSFWNAADAAMSIGTLGLDVAGAVTPAGVARFGLREAASLPRAFLKTSGIRPELAGTLEANYRRTAELNSAFRAKKSAGAPAAELAAIREQSWKLYRENADLQTEIPALKEFFTTAAPGKPASPEVMQVVAANMGTELETVSGVRLANYTSLARDMKAGSVLPNPGKALDDGTMSGSAAHLLKDGSAHMVSVADRLTSGLVLLMTGYADAHRATKTMSGLMYEFKGVKNAARVPLPREVFSDALTQGELMVPEVPLQNIKGVRSWRAEINPANADQLIFRYSEPVVAVEGLNAEALVSTLKDMPHANTMRVDIPRDLAPFTNRQAR